MDQQPLQLLPAGGLRNPVGPLCSNISGPSTNDLNGEVHLDSTALTAFFMASLPESVTHNQSTHTENVDHNRPPQSHSYVTPNGHGPAPSTAPSSATNMGDMRTAYPGYQFPQFPPDQYNYNMQPQFVMQPPGVFYHMYPHPSFQGGHPVPYPTVYPQYYPQQHQQPHFQGAPTYMHPPASSSHPGVHVPMYGHSVGYGSGYYPSPYPIMLGHGPGPHPRQHAHPQSGSQYLNPHDPGNQGGSSASQSGSPRQVTRPAHDGSKTIVNGSTSMKSDSRVMSGIVSPSPFAPNSTRNTTLGGQRRTPKQSGHALWVGNLPPGTSIVDLKDHFSQDVADDIESVFLISKSNCAFINYRTEAVCYAAQTKFHDSRFQGVRLVCRLRRGPISAGSNGKSGNMPAVKSEGEKIPESGSAGNKPLSSARLPNRYFVVKSLTMKDLESSRQSGIWATQTHNETNLNRAYETADNVYLIFSANKSGEYYGYARMVSPIQEDEKLALEVPPRSNQVIAEVEEPNVTFTEASSTARSGRIIDDPVRGTIFWEADTSAEEEADGTDRPADDADDATSDKSTGTATVEKDGTGSQTIGRPFRIQWLSTERVPFYRTRGLRNPWNANRGVKIARDGTEIEPNVGSQLVELFHIPSPGPDMATHRLLN